MKVNQGKIHYNWFIIGILTATFWLTVSANYDDYPTECPKQDPLNYTVLLPHETDCDKYYACSNGRKILMHCPLMDDEGNRLYFSQKLHVCVYPEQSDCTPQTTTTEQTTRPTETTTRIPSTTTTKRPTTTTKKPMPTTTTTKAPTTMTQPPTTGESTTASEVVSTSNPPTTTIVTSTTGQPTSSSGTTTNEPSITTTELPSSSTVVTSTNNPSTTTEITSTTGQTTSSTGSTSNKPPVTWTTHRPSPSTEASTTSAPLPLCTESTTGVYFAHESYPHLYYECNYGDLIRRECEENSNFDVTDQMCVWSIDTDYSENSTEVPTTIEPTNSSEISSLCNSDGSNSTCGRHPHECDCHKFYVCIDGNAVLRICPSSLSFNPTLKECDLSENVKCGGDNGGGDNGDGNTTTTPIPTECPPDNTGWAVQLPHETNCSLFYKCNWGEKFVLPCRPGLHFNPRLQVCDWPCAAGCTAEGGDGSNTCNSPNHPGSEMPVEHKPFLRFGKLANVASHDDDDEDRSIDN